MVVCVPLHLNPYPSTLSSPRGTLFVHEKRSVKRKLRSNASTCGLCQLIITCRFPARRPRRVGREGKEDWTLQSGTQRLFCSPACLGRVHSGSKRIHLSARETLPLSKPGPEGTVYTVTLWVKCESISHKLAPARGRVVKLVYSSLNLYIHDCAPKAFVPATRRPHKRTLL